MGLFLETKNLILREFKETDIAHIFELDSNPEVHKYLGNKSISTYKEAEDTLTFFLDQYASRKVGRFALFEKSSGYFVGRSGLKLNISTKEQLNSFTNFIDIGYPLISKFWGNDYATKSAIKCLDYGFRKKYLIIYGAVVAANVGFNKVLEKIGLKFIKKFPLNGMK